MTTAMFYIPGGIPGEHHGIWTSNRILLGPGDSVGPLLVSASVARRRMSILSTRPHASKNGLPNTRRFARLAHGPVCQRRKGHARALGDVVHAVDWPHAPESR